MSKPAPTLWTLRYDGPAVVVDLPCDDGRLCMHRLTGRGDTLPALDTEGRAVVAGQLDPLPGAVLVWQDSSQPRPPAAKPAPRPERVTKPAPEPEG